MTTYNYLSLFGIPTIIFSLMAYVYNRVKKTSKENDAIKLGLQALLRDRLYQLYGFCKEKGSATQYERQNFNSMYEQYHNLGGNGVMTDVKNKFFELEFADDHQ